MARIVIYLNQDHILALAKLSREEYRTIREQAAFMICQELHRRGLVHQQNPLPSPPRNETEATISADDSASCN